MKNNMKYLFIILTCLPVFYEKDSGKLVENFDNSPVYKYKLDNDTISLTILNEYYLSLATGEIEYGLSIDKKSLMRKDTFMIFWNNKKYKSIKYRAPIMQPYNQFIFIFGQAVN